MNLLSRTRTRNPLAIMLFGLLVFGFSSPSAMAGKEEEAQQYAKDLKSDDPKVRAQALAELGRLGQLMKGLISPAIPDMMAALDDKDPAVRAAAARAVGKIDPDADEVLPIYRKMLNKKEPNEVRMGAIQGLGSLGPKARPTVKDLRAIIEDEGQQTPIGRNARNAIRAINQR